MIDSILPKNEVHTNALPISEFPDELILEILNHVPHKDLLDNCQFVCRQWNRLLPELEALKEVFWLLKLKETERKNWGVIPDFSNTISNIYLHEIVAEWAIRQNAFPATKYLLRDRKTWIIPTSSYSDIPTHRVVERWLIPLFSTEHYHIYKGQYVGCYSYQKIGNPENEIINEFYHHEITKMAKGPGDSLYIVRNPDKTIIHKDLTDPDRTPREFTVDLPSEETIQTMFFYPYIWFYHSKGTRRDQIAFHVETQKFSKFTPFSQLLKQRDLTHSATFEALSVGDQHHILEVETCRKAAFPWFWFPQLTTTLKIWHYNNVDLTFKGKETFTGEPFDLDFKMFHYYKNQLLILVHQRLHVGLTAKSAYSILPFDRSSCSFIEKIPDAFSEPPQLIGNFLFGPDWEKEETIHIYHLPSNVTKHHTLEDGFSIISSMIHDNKLQLIANHKDLGAYIVTFDTPY